MDIQFANSKLKKIFNDDKELTRTYGKLAPKIKLRMNVLRNAPNLGFVPAERPDRCHMLKADRKGQFAVDLLQPHRLVFKPTPNPPPMKNADEIDKEQVVSVTIIEVTDYHD